MGNLTAVLGAHNGSFEPMRDRMQEIPDVDIVEKNAVLAEIKIRTSVGNFRELVYALSDLPVQIGALNVENLADEDEVVTILKTNQNMRLGERSATSSA